MTLKQFTASSSQEKGPHHAEPHGEAPEWGRRQGEGGEDPVGLLTVFSEDLARQGRQVTASLALVSSNSSGELCLRLSGSRLPRISVRVVLVCVRVR